MHYWPYFLGILLIFNTWNHFGHAFEEECFTQIIFPKNNETIYQLMLLPITHGEPNTIEVELQFNTTCFTPISLSLECISDICGNNFVSLDYNEIEVFPSNKTFRDLTFVYNLTYGSYRLRGDGKEHDFKIEKKFQFRQHPSLDHYIMVNNEPTLGMRTKFGRASFWDLAGNSILLDSFPWTIEIGSFCAFALGAKMVLTQEVMPHSPNAISHFGFDSFLSTSAPEAYPMDYPRDFAGRRHVKIGNDVWIGYGAVIINSVTIGDGAVIGAYAVVREDVPPYAIVVGNPARILRYRFNETQIKMLLEIAWWEWPDEEILFRMPRRDDFDAFVRYNESRLLSVSSSVDADDESVGGGRDFGEFAEKIINTAFSETT